MLYLLNGNCNFITFGMSVNSSVSWFLISVPKQFLDLLPLIPPNADLKIAGKHFLFRKITNT